MLPAGTAMIDRHELIARRGVACDRVVDTQVPQDSVYALTASRDGRYTDTDAELFGLASDEVPLVRAAYEALLHFERAETLRQQHRRLAALVRLAFESDRRRERLLVEESTHAPIEDRHALVDPRPHAQVLPDTARFAQAGLDRRVCENESVERLFRSTNPDVPCYRDPQEMFDRHPDLQAVVLASANSRHLEQVRAVRSVGSTSSR